MGQMMAFCPVCGELLRADDLIYEVDNGYLPGEIVGCEYCCEYTDDLFKTTAWEKDYIWR